MPSRIAYNAASTSVVAKPLAALALAWHSLAAYRLDSYRPEKHYMRGPGPKWHEKHGRSIESPRGGSIAGD